MSVVSSIAVLGIAALLAGTSPAALAQVPISGMSLNPDGGDPNNALAVTACNGAPQIGVVYRNSETEPHIAVDPTNPSRMIAGWHQDRWSTGGAQSLGAAYTADGGATWTQVVIPFTRCAGGLPRSAGDFERASDPWISFSPNGTAHYMALATKNSVNENAMTVARSTDGGKTWTKPVFIKHSQGQDPGRSLFNDKNSITADPHHSNLVYATWTMFRNGITSLVFSRSTDGGKTWSPASPIATMGSVDKSEKTVFRQGATIVVLPDGTLVDAFFRILFDDRTKQSTVQQAILRSVDQGKHWSRTDFPVSSFIPAGAFDPDPFNPDLFIPVRDASELPSIAVNRTTGRLYLTWQVFNTATGVVDIVISTSGDGGATWSQPVPVVRGTSGVQTFLPIVAVNDDGLVGVLFYDFRNDVLGDDELSTDVHLSLFNADLSFREERRLTPQSFDMRQMVITGPRGYFPGDYVGLSTAGKDFVAAFTRANNLGLEVAFPQDNNGVFVDSNDRQSIVFVKQTP